MQNIITLTMNPAVDWSISTSHVHNDEKLRCSTLLYEPGGGGINVSRAIKRLGGSSTALYTAGGYSGKKFQELLNDEGVCHRCISIEGETRENIIVFEKSSVRQFRFIMPGPSVKKGEWEKTLQVLSDFSPIPHYIVMSGSLPPGVPEDFGGRLANIAKKHNAKLIVDTSGPALKSALDEGVYMVKPNLREIRNLTGSKIFSEEEQEEAVRELVNNKSTEIVVLSLGAAGILMANADQYKRYRAPSVPIASKVGAGDSMVAGIVLGLARGLSLQDALLHGIAAGSAAVMTPGTELCRKKDVDTLYKRLQSEQLSTEDDNGK